MRRSTLLTIPKATRLVHVIDNAAAGDLSLTAAELSRIDAAIPIGQRPRALPQSDTIIGDGYRAC